MIRGVNTIAWKWFKTGSPAAGTKRRKLKVEIGRKHLDMPMLDMRHSKNHLEFCDIVISTDNIQTWQKAIHQFYGINSALLKTSSTSITLVILKSSKHIAIVLVKIFSRWFFANKKLVIWLRTAKFGDVT